MSVVVSLLDQRIAQLEADIERDKQRVEDLKRERDELVAELQRLKNEAGA